MTNKELLNTLNKRLDQAKRFTEEHYINEVKRNVSDYNANPVNVSEILGVTDASRALQMALNNRYQNIRPLIFVNTEAAKAEMFDRPPEILTTGRGKKDLEKQETVEAVYEYLKDTLDLESFAWDAGHWFILTGFTSADVGYKTESHSEMVTDPETGEPLMDEEGNPLMREVIDYDDPTIQVSDPLKTFYAPSSEFTVDGKKVDYRFYSMPVSVAQVKKLYSEVEDIDDLKGNYTEKYEDDKSDNDNPDKIVLNYYCGTIPEECAEDLEDYQEDAIYSIVFVNNKTLEVTRKDRKSFKLAKWYGHPNQFFGFGFGTIGAPFQKEKSIRVGQRIRLADIAAFPKIAIKNDGKNKIDPQSMRDPRENQVILYETEAPSVLQPGTLNDVVTAAEESAESDAQSAFGLLDISAGTQNTRTVDTATGQSIFAEASQRRIRQAKRIFMKFYQDCIVELFKECAENWSDDKVLELTDEQGNEYQKEVNMTLLRDIDFDKDIRIDAESMGVNKDVIRAQIISLYNMMKDDPMINRRAIVEEVMSKGFDEKNPERFLMEAVAEPGTQLVNPQTGEKFVVDKGGQLTSAEQMETMGGDETNSDIQEDIPGNIPIDQSGVQNTTY